MPDHIRELRRPIVRRVGRLVFTITADGVELRGYRRRKPKVVTWAQIASLADATERSLLVDCEQVAGLETLLKMKAHPREAIKEPQKEPPKE